LIAAVLIIDEQNTFKIWLISNIYLYIHANHTYLTVNESLKGTSLHCVAFDPSNTNHAYCGTFDNGLWERA
jgi:hypothetical protein